MCWKEFISLKEIVVLAYQGDPVCVEDNRASKFGLCVSVFLVFVLSK